MKQIQRTLVALFIIVLGISACKKAGVTPDPVTPPDVVLDAPDGFNYQTNKMITLNVQLQSGSGEALNGVMVNVYNTYEADGGRILYTGITNAEGKIVGDIEVPAYLQSVIVDPSYIGVLRNAKVTIQSNAVTALLGGINGFGGNVVPDQLSLSEIRLQSEMPFQNTLAAFTYMGTYSNAGVPNYLERDKEVIDAKLLEYINASLPEQKPVTTYHPEYLNQTAATNLKIVEKSDVWVTFVHEGAGYLNALFYYTYATGKAPKTDNDIVNPKVIFPNASLPGSGGGLNTGSKVYLGVFEAGTTIGFGLVANGWNGSTNKVGAGNHIVYADDALNPESNPLLKRHTVLLYDDSRKLFLTGFEDLNRQGSSDDDFNDLIFYAKSNPVKGISQDDVNPIDKPIDTDKDGVSDVYDKFPTDPTRAYIRYFPSENTYGTLAFEDLWPATGDYDMNDLVVEYKYALISNGLNKAVEMKANYKIAAIGASFVNGFGVQMPFSAGSIKSVTGAKFTGKLNLTMSANGTEAGQSKAVIIPFDNAFSLVNLSGGFVNTYLGSAKVTSEELNMLVTFTSPLDASNFNSMTFNPFLIRNGNRAYEVHLPGMLPTDKADKKMFNTSQDNTIPAQNKYYKTKTNMPYAIGFIEKFFYPVELTNIKSAYLHYEDWVKSGGSTFADWYSNKATGYRTTGKVFE